MLGRAVARVSAAHPGLLAESLKVILCPLHVHLDKRFNIAIRGETDDREEGRDEACTQAAQHGAQPAGPVACSEGRCSAVARERFATREQAKAQGFEYIEVDYNRTRLPPTLGYLSPEQYQRTHVAWIGVRGAGARSVLFLTKA
ncbi:IS3 family transposase [Stenotrophomonas nitritireducens]|uniref:IS3 family transposase n=1 Tax=Stenotrophomonas nitritireducens TaxID=83617 RepID=UPI0009EA0F8F